MTSTPNTTELMSTIVRLEQRYRRDGNATALFAVYEKLCERFEEDLTEERDVLLSKAAALMVIKYWVRRHKIVFSSETRPYLKIDFNT